MKTIAIAIAIAIPACSETAEPSGSKPAAEPSAYASARSDAAQPRDCPAVIPEDTFSIGDTPISVEIHRLGPPSQPPGPGDLVRLNPPRGASTLGTSAPTTVPLQAGRRHVVRLDDLRGRTYVSTDGGPEKLVAIAIRPDRFDVGLTGRAGLAPEAIALDERLWHLGHRFAKCVDTPSATGVLTLRRASADAPWKVDVAANPGMSASARTCWDDALATMPEPSEPDTLLVAELGYGTLNALQTFSDAERDGLLAIDLELSGAHANLDLPGLPDGSWLSIRRSAPVVRGGLAAPESPSRRLATPTRGYVRLDGVDLQEIALAPNTRVLELRRPAAGRTDVRTIPAASALVRLVVDDVALSEGGGLDLAPWPALVHLELTAAPEQSLQTLTASTPAPPLASLVLRGFQTVDLSWLDAWPALESVVVEGGRVTRLPSKVGPALTSVTLRHVEIDRNQWSRLAQHEPRVQWNDDPAEDVRTRFACATAVEVRNRICDARNEDLRHRIADHDEIASVIARLRPTGAHDYGAWACGGPSFDVLAGAERLGQVAVPTCDGAILGGWAAMMALSTDPGRSICEWLAPHGMTVPVSSSSR